MTNRVCCREKWSQAAQNFHYQIRAISEIEKGDDTKLEVSGERAGGSESLRLASIADVELATEIWETHKKILILLRHGRVREKSSSESSAKVGKETNSTAGRVSRKLLWIKRQKTRIKGNWKQINFKREAIKTFLGKARWKNPVERFERCLSACFLIPSSVKFDFIREIVFKWGWVSWMKNPIEKLESGRRNVPLTSTLPTHEHEWTMFLVKTLLKPKSKNVLLHRWTWLEFKWRHGWVISHHDARCVHDNCLPTLGNRICRRQPWSPRSHNPK